jgi:hypothetical protein
MFESTDNVIVQPIVGDLPQLLEQLHALFTQHNPRVVFIDRDQGTLMALPYGIAGEPEFTEMSLTLLLQQVPIDVAPAVASVEQLTQIATDRGLAAHTLCASHESAAQLGAVDMERVLWTNIVTQGSLLLVCQEQSSRAWKLLLSQLQPG